MNCDIFIVSGFVFTGGVHPFRYNNASALTFIAYNLNFF